jgi:hypothetical protein
MQARIAAEETRIQKLIDIMNRTSDAIKAAHPSLVLLTVEMIEEGQRTIVKLKQKWLLGSAACLLNKIAISTVFKDSPVPSYVNMSNITNYIQTKEEMMRLRNLKNEWVQDKVWDNRFENLVSFWKRLTRLQEGNNVSCEVAENTSTEELLDAARASFSPDEAVAIVTCIKSV